jgi:DNA-binding transcriptional ArsR family regulator
MEEKITIEKDVFKALASETRIKMLKILDTRRHTQSEIAVSLSLSVPTVKEHLDAMEKAGLVKPIEEGYKWKYYELTEKSKCILDPERKKVWILLGFWIVAAAGTFAVFFSKFFMFGRAQTTSFKALSAQETLMAAAPKAAEAMEISKPFPYAEVIVVAILIVLTLLLVYFILRSKLLKKH